MVSVIHLCHKAGGGHAGNVLWFLDCIIIRAYIFRWKMVCDIHVAHSFGSWSKIKLMEIILHIVNCPRYIKLFEPAPYLQ